MKKFKKALLLSLSLIVFSCFFAGCGEDDKDTTGGSASQVDTTQNSNTGTNQNNSIADDIGNGMEDVTDGITGGVEDVTDGVVNGVDDATGGNNNTNNNNGSNNNGNNNSGNNANNNSSNNKSTETTTESISGNSGNNQ